MPKGPARVLMPYGGELRAARQSFARAAVLRLALRRGDMVLPGSWELRTEIVECYAIPAERVEVHSWGVSEELIAARPLISPESVRASLGIPDGAIVVLSIRAASPIYQTLSIVSAFAQALPSLTRPLPSCVRWRSRRPGVRTADPRNLLP